MTMRDCSARSLTFAAALLLSSTDALAGHQTVYGGRTDAYAASQAHQGPYVQGSTYRVVNGVVDNYYTQQGPGGTVTGGGSLAKSSVAVTQPGGAGGQLFGNAAAASADLGRGLLKATTESYGPNNFGSPLGFASARLDDTIFFTNNSGATQTISFTYRFDGKLIDPAGGNPGGSVSLGFSCGGNSGACYNAANNTGDAITFADANGNALSLYGGLRHPEDSWSYYFGTSGACFGENLYCGDYSKSLWEYGLNAPNTGGVVDGYIRAYLNIPTGMTSLGFMGTLNLDCRGASSCDFGHTGAFGFGTLPDGLTFSSASGVFLTDRGMPGGVPEPASWALMLGGFGLAGAAVRRRRVQLLA